MLGCKQLNYILSFVYVLCIKILCALEIYVICTKRLFAYIYLSYTLVAIIEYKIRIFMQKVFSCLSDFEIKGCHGFAKINHKKSVGLYGI